MDLKEQEKGDIQKVSVPVTSNEECHTPPQKKESIKRTNKDSSIQVVDLAASPKRQKRELLTTPYSRNNIDGP